MVYIHRCRVISTQPRNEASGPGAVNAFAWRVLAHVRSGMAFIIVRKWDELFAVQFRLECASETERVRETLQNKQLFVPLSFSTPFPSD